MTHKISHSEIKQFQTCEYKWFYGSHKSLMPIGGFPVVMEVGTFGHSLMEACFRTIQAGGTYEEAAASCGDLLLSVMDTPEKMKVYRNVLAFVAYVQENEYRIIDIEDKQSWPMTNSDTEFGFTPDLTLEHTRGPLKGSLFVVDYKFTGQYWTDREINLHQQVPKYMHYKSKATGLNIRRGAIVMLNTRATATDTGAKLFFIKWITPTSKRFQILERENETMLKKLNDLRQMPDEELKEVLVHNGNEKTCKFCWFADDLCPMEFDGRDVSKVIERNFKINDYGYNEPETPVL